MSGWFAVKRGTLEHELFAPQGKWSRYEAWMWLVENAAYKPTEIDIGGKPYTVPRGALCYSLRFLAEKWGWSVKVVRTFLERLQSHRAIDISTAQIGTKKGTARTLIKLCNYDKYQSAGQGEGTARAQQGHKEEQGNNIPVGANADAPADPVKLVFDAGVRLLMASGKKNPEARQIVGKWRKGHSDEALLAAIGRCQREGAVDPVGYISGALRFQRVQEEKRKTHPEIDDIRVVQGVTKRYAGNGVGWITVHD